MIGSVYFLVMAFNLVTYCSGWVITDVNYNELLKNHGENFNEIVNERLDGDKSRPKFSLLYPGTKWCGPGNIADNYDDLGPETESDMCCREHDNCPDVLHGLETRNNLTNVAFYSRLSCKCDENFRRCLYAANSAVADQIGNIYFNALGTQCFREDYPITGCKQRGGWLYNKCLQYTYDESGERLLQWFDVPNYYLVQ